MTNDLQPDFTQTVDMLNQGVAAGVFPCAEFLIARSGDVILQASAGDLPSDCFFDLASLTKPLATAFLAMILFDQKKIDLNAKLSHYIPTTHTSITIRQLLNHTSGLVDWHAFYQDIPLENWINYQDNKNHIIHRILTDAQFMRHSRDVHYSDLGYMILGYTIEFITGKSLDQNFETLIAQPLELSESMFFIPKNKLTTKAPTQFVPTEICPERQTVSQGYVMDQNCFVMGGVSGHAGLFSNTISIHALLNEFRKARLKQSQLVSQTAFEIFCTPDAERDRKEFYFTLGFDTPTNGISQAGHQFSKNTIGHLGYSGTSFWWDLERDIWMILLTNRCMPDRGNHKIRDFRPALHDTAFLALQK